MKPFFGAYKKRKRHAHLVKNALFGIKSRVLFEIAYTLVFCQKYLTLRRFGSAAQYLHKQRFSRTVYADNAYLVALVYAEVYS